MDDRGEALSSEADLVRRARQGDSEAWEALVKTHQEPVFRLAYLLLGDADEAEDAAQETLVRAYRALHRFDVDRPLRPWLLSIAANQVRNRRRSLGRYLGAVQRLFRDHPAVEASFEEKVFQRWQAETLWQAIRRLKLDDQQVIYMRYFLEIPVEEVASTLAIAEGTVKSRLHRAISRLQKVIEADFPILREAGWEGPSAGAGSTGETDGHA